MASRQAQLKLVHDNGGGGAAHGYSETKERAEAMVRFRAVAEVSRPSVRTRHSPRIWALVRPPADDSTI